MFIKIRTNCKLQKTLTIFFLSNYLVPLHFGKGYWHSSSIGSSIGIVPQVQYKESACSAGDKGCIPGLGRSPEEGNGSPLQYSCLENPMDREAWWTVVHGISKNWIRMSMYVHCNGQYQYSGETHLSCIILVSESDWR